MPRTLLRAERPPDGWSASMTMRGLQSIATKRSVARQPICVPGRPRSQRQENYCRRLGQKGQCGGALVTRVPRLLANPDRLTKSDRLNPLGRPVACSSGTPPLAPGPGWAGRETTSRKMTVPPVADQPTICPLLFDCLVARNRMACVFSARPASRFSKTFSTTYRAWSASSRTVTSRGGSAEARADHRFFVYLSSARLITAFAAARIGCVER